MMRAWRITRIVLGVASLIIGTAALLASIAAAGTVSGVDATVGRSGVVTTPVGSVESGVADVAVIADGVTARWELDEQPEWVATALRLIGTDADTFVDQVGDFVFIVSPMGSGDVFVGLAPADSVNTYLDGTPYSVAVREGDRWPTIEVPGEGAPTTLPADAGIWVAEAAGAPAELPVERLDGSTLVLMNTDATPGVAATMRLEYRVPDATRTMEGAAVTAAAGSVGGVLLVLLGAFLVVGKRRRGRHA